MFYLSIGAMFKNENRYLREWIEFHLMMGVEHFFLVCNDSDPKPALDILRPYMDKITFSHSPGGYIVQKQLDIYDSILKSARSVSRWVAFIDLDEFLMPNDKTHQLKTILSGLEQYVGIGVNWVAYGSSGLFFYPQLQTESFIYRATYDSVHCRLYKSIVNPARTIRAINPHSFSYVNNELAVDEFSQKLISGTCSNYNNAYVGKMLRINHYRTRSWIDYLDKHNKWKNGGHPDFFNKDNNNHSFMYYWNVNDINEVVDTTAHQYLPELKRRLMITKPCEHLAPLPLHQDQITTLHDFF